MKPVGKSKSIPGKASSWLDASATDDLRVRLVNWFRAGHRDLPWRRDREPYRILVSEAMLVQTTVAAVIPYFERFLDRFPTVESLAAAPEAEVLKLWEGLGYYRRARQLQAAARAVVERHDGQLPRDVDALRSLPGVGRYIAGAIASFAFDIPAPIVEANTQRVLCRLLAWQEPITTTRSQTRLWELAAQLVPPSAAGEFNQAIMELGATLCLPRQPSCLLCPISAYCQARSTGLEELLPIRATRAEPLAVTELSLVLCDQGRWLFLRRQPGRLWEQFWEFPTLHLSGADPAGRGSGAGADPTTRADEFERLTGVRVALGDELATIRFSVTRHRVHLTAIAGHQLSGRPHPAMDAPQHDLAAWLTPEEIDGLPMSAPMRRLAKRLITTPESNL